MTDVRPAVATLDEVICRRYRLDGGFATQVATLKEDGVRRYCVPKDGSARSVRSNGQPVDRLLAGMDSHLRPADQRHSSLRATKGRG